MGLGRSRSQAGARPVSQPPTPGAGPLTVMVKMSSTKFHKGLLESAPKHSLGCRQLMGWMAPWRHRRAKMVVVKDHQQREPSMGDITTIGLDLAKNVFQVHAVDVAGSVVLRKRQIGRA